MPTDEEPPARLLCNRSYWGMLFTQFLGAFNDNVFKQLMLLLAIPLVAAAASSSATFVEGTSLSPLLKGGASFDTAAAPTHKQQDKDQQGLATFLFSLPFVLFSGYAGYLSDRYSKRTIIVLCKVAEIFVMLLGMAAFLYFARTGFAGLLVVLFLMGVHSAFFGPPKYGVLPQIVSKQQLPLANGLILMTTFLAIIFGMVLAGMLGKLLKGEADDASQLWLGSLFCIGLAIAGTLTSLLIRPLPAQSPGLKFHWDAIGIPHETRSLLLSDRPLCASLLVSSLFWLVSGIAIQAVNSLGKVQLRLDDLYTSSLAAVVGVGIMIGSLLAGTLSRGVGDFRFVMWGGWGLFFSLFLISISLPGETGWHHMLGYGGSLFLLALAGISAGMFAVPVQVFLQTRPPDDQKGRMIAVMNLVNFIAIMISGVIYDLMDRLVTWLGMPRSEIFLLIALLMLPVVLRKNGGLGKGDIPEGSGAQHAVQ